MLSKIFTHWLFPVVTCMVLLTVHIGDSTPVEILRLKQFDLLQQTDIPVRSTDIGIVTLDEKAIEKYGQWPWKRDVLADIIWRLREAGANIIVLPILMAETDRLGGDEDLADALYQNGIVIAQVGSGQVNKGGMPRGVAKIGDPIPYLFEWDGMLGPIPLLGQTADGVGVLNTVPEIDGVVRRLPLMMSIGEEVYPSIAVEVLRVATGNPSYQVKANDGGIVAVRVKGFPIIKTDANARIWLRWNKTFDEISAAETDFSAFSGRMVIIGATAEGLGGFIATPTGPKHNYLPSAVSLQTMLDGETILRPWWSRLLEIYATLQVGFLLIIAARFFTYRWAGAIVVGSVGGLVFASWWYWTTALMLLDVTMPIISVILVGFHAIFLRFILEFRQKQQIKKQFGTYLSPDLVNKLAKDPTLLKLGGESRELSIMFTDVRGFTNISEHYGKDVQGLTVIMNRYMTAMTKKILENNGTLDKYIGDAQMAFWNAPLDNKNHAKDSVKTALEMMESLNEFNEEVVSEGIPAFGMGLGINTDTVVVGNMGSDQRFDYTCLGDGVNTAARLEGQSKNYGVKIILGENTALAIEDEYAVVRLDCLAVKGKTQGVNLYTVIGTHEWANENTSYVLDTQQHDKMLELYKSQSWKIATKFCNELKGGFGGALDDYYDLWIERIAEMKSKKLPKDWDGIYRATSK